MIKVRPATREEINAYYDLCQPFHEEIHKRRQAKELYDDVLDKMKEARNQAGFFVSDQGIRIKTGRKVTWAE